MGKLEKLGRSILKKFGGSRRSTSRRRREEDVAANATSSSSTSSDEERDQGYIHKFQVVPPEDVIMNSEDVASEDVRMASPAASDEGSAGYATDDTALSSLSPLDIKRVSVDYSESQGYYSNAELSPIPRIEITVPPQDGTVGSLSPRSPMRSPIQQAPPIPRIVGVTVPEAPVPRTPLYTKKPSQEYPRIDVRNRLKPKPIYKSSQLLAENKENVPSEKIERSATLSNLTSSEEEDPIERFMKSHIYKTKMITTVFEAKDRGFEEITGDVIHEIDRWFESKNMMAVACELHWSVPTSKRSRQLECKLKEKLLQALRENNKRLLYLRGMGHGKTPVKLAESKTMENISKDRETDSVRGIYQRSYTRLLPYLHKETPEWHSQYWTLQDLENSDDVTSPEYPIQPMPQKFLFDTEPSDLLITATNSEDDSVTSSTILKVHVENLDDNEPRFLESAVPVFQILANTSKPTAIGRLTAQDPDSNPIFYHLLPNCGSTEISKNFSIDSEFGEISYLPKTTTVPPGKYELCFIVSPEKNLDTSEVFFDGNKPNFLKVLVDFVVDQNVKGSGKYDNIGVSGNQSLSRVGDVLDRIDIPMLMNAGSAEFELENLQFVPANYELGRDMISPEGAVELNKKTGEIVANGKILDTPQGVYTAEISRGQGRAVKQLHHIRNDRKLRYVLSMSRNEFGANLEKFKKQILEAIAKNDQKAGKQLDIHFDEPKAERKNSTWTSVCFYLTRENAILDDKQSSALISPSNGHISKLHHIFKVQNVDVCSPRVSASSESSTSSDIPLNTLILIGVVGLLIIALVALLVFVCCVSRYQTYLKQKAERMRCSSSTGSYYKSPNLIPPPPPGYMHTPPLPPPPPPQAIAYY